MSERLLPPLRVQTSTRILWLKPSANVQDPLIAGVSEIDLTSPVCPEYECISYTWGAVTYDSHHTISINGKLVRLRTNLFNALCRFRFPTCSRRLWVDALCIAQDDSEEKSAQVRMISDIFKKATKVLVWLGEHEHGSEEIFRATFLRSVWKQTWTDKLGLGSARRNTKRTTNQQIWTCFLQREYWQRCWIVQEVACARQLALFCGSDEMGWDRLREIMLQESARPPLTGNEDLQTKHAEAELSVHQLLSVRKRTSDDWTFIKLIETTASRACTDLRDRIYSIVSLEPDPEMRCRIPVDYSLDMPNFLAQVIKAAPMPFRTAECLLQKRSEDSFSESHTRDATEILLGEAESLDLSVLDALEEFLPSPLKFKWLGHSPQLDRREDFDEERRRCMINWREEMRSKGIVTH